MYLIVGLGNPTMKYNETRHNVGFAALDRVAEQYGIDVDRRKGRAYAGKGLISGVKVILAKPQTFMNLSGESVRALVDYYKIKTETELIVIYDDVSLDVGQLRIRKKGSAGGHNGIKNIITNLGTENFCRIKIGVGEKPPRIDLADYVLGRFSKNDRIWMHKAFDLAAEALELMVHGEVDQAMNNFNRKIIHEEE